MGNLQHFLPISLILMGVYALRLIARNTFDWSQKKIDVYAKLVESELGLISESTRQINYRPKQEDKATVIA